MFVEGNASIAVSRWPLGSGAWFPDHVHQEHQLSWTSRGVLGIEVGDRYWVLPPTRALWTPAGVPHRTGAARQAVLHRLYVPADRTDLGQGRAVPVAVDGLLVALAARLARTDLSGPARRRAEGVVMDGLRTLADAPVDLPDPVDDRARAVAAALHEDPADWRGLAAHASAVGSSRRTLSRLFVQDTGLTFESWRTRLRLRTGLILLAEGLPVARVARTVGYSTPSVFLVAFRRVVGTTPGSYLAAADRRATDVSPGVAEGDDSAPADPRTR